MCTRRENTGHYSVRLPTQPHTTAVVLQRCVGLRNLSQRSYNGRVLSDEGRVVVEMRIMDFIVVVDGEFREHWATIGPLQPVQQA